MSKFKVGNNIEWLDDRGVKHVGMVEGIFDDCYSGAIVDQQIFTDFKRQNIPWDSSIIVEAYEVDVQVNLGSIGRITRDMIRRDSVSPQFFRALPPNVYFNFYFNQRIEGCAYKVRVVFVESGGSFRAGDMVTIPSTARNIDLVSTVGQLKRKRPEEEEEEKEKKTDSGQGKTFIDLTLPEKITITVTTTTGRLFTFTVQSTNTILEVKEMLQKLLPNKIEPAYQKLFFGGNELVDANLVSDYDIANGSIIYVVFKLRPLKKQDEDEEEAFQNMVRRSLRNRSHLIYNLLVRYVATDTFYEYPPDDREAAFARAYNDEDEPDLAKRREWYTREWAQYFKVPRLEKALKHARQVWEKLEQGESVVRRMFDLLQRITLLETLLRRDTDYDVNFARDNYDLIAEIGKYLETDIEPLPSNATHEEAVQHYTDVIERYRAARAAKQEQIDTPGKGPQSFAREYPQITKDFERITYAQTRTAQQRRNVGYTVSLQQFIRSQLDRFKDLRSYHMGEMEGGMDFRARYAEILSNRDKTNRAIKVVQDVINTISETKDGSTARVRNLDTGEEIDLLEDIDYVWATQELYTMDRWRSDNPLPESKKYRYVRREWLRTVDYLTELKKRLETYFDSFGDELHKVTLKVVEDDAPDTNLNAKDEEDIFDWADIEEGKSEEADKEWTYIDDEGGFLDDEDAFLDLDENDPLMEQEGERQLGCSMCSIMNNDLVKFSCSACVPKKRFCGHYCGQKHMLKVHS